MEKSLKRYIEGMSPRILGENTLRVKRVKRFVRGGSHTQITLLVYLPNITIYS